MSDARLAPIAWAMSSADCASGSLLVSTGDAYAAPSAGASSSSTGASALARAATGS